MSKLSAVQNKTIEEFWINTDDYRKQLKFREWELLNPHQENEQVGSRGGNISDTTGNRAMMLATDKHYQHLQNVINVIDKLYHELDFDQKTIVDMRYWDKDENCYEWADVADKLYMSVQRVLRKRNHLIDETARRLGWV